MMIRALPPFTAARIPGPDYLGRKPVGDTVAIFDAHDRMICEMRSIGVKNDLQNAHNVAHLFAAAPDLLEACKAAVAFYGDNCFGPCVHDKCIDVRCSTRDTCWLWKAKASIAKVEGRD